ncbi:h aca ribonucleoprotein complex subunit 1 [Diplodia corticola]|uniref:H/ACA ribonucleoprotein complex subunit n=1 Tax=Diplodia corticola TaxID=236234 RepID=A0A1J9R8V3_9PEZI|nr:h aca ribonucleoprotein complex subunit 1 [Diplodia corticola]OJD37990.1 h aca ribonucleoprotein complex subunit 1 [Diplodia corticola]
MSFRGGSRGGGRGGGSFGARGGGGGFRGGRGGGRGGFSQPMGPPDQVFEMGSFMHACEGEIVCESINTKIPYFNAPIYLENKSPIGKVDEILGPLNQVYFTIKPQEGIQATSFKQGDKFYIGGDKLLPLDRFLPKPKPPGGMPKPKRAGGSGRGGAPRGGRGSFGGGFGGRGGRGGAPRGRGGSFGGRGGSRGGFSSGGFSGGRGAPRGGGRGRGRY